jgi:hypothetical protein
MFNFLKYLFIKKETIDKDVESNNEDICEDLRNFAYIVDNSVGSASLVMLNGRIFSEAADEIESLRLKLKSLNEIE